MPTAPGLSSIQHIVVLMLENRSFDHMLGFLYADRNNVAPSGAAFDGLTGHESNPDSQGHPVTVFQITSTTPNAYFMPGADPGEGYAATNHQLFGSGTPPSPPTATMAGFVQDFAYTLGWQKKKHWSILPGTVPGSIMGMFTPAMLPVLSGLARGFAVCDRWFASVPTETLPNRAFASAGTSQGHMDDVTKTFTCPSIFGALGAHNITWAIYGYTADPLTRMTFTDIQHAPNSHFGHFTDFQAAAQSGNLPAYVLLEPEWSSTGNSQHPNYNVALGEQFIHDVYTTLRSASTWNQTLLIVTYDEHGGCYDHVPPPSGAVPPDKTVGEFGFDFKRFGVRVPTVLVSPLIPAGTVFRASGSTPLDHTSILKTVEQRWGLPALTARDAAAPDVGGALTLATPRTDDPLAGVTVPKAAAPPADSPQQPSHLEEVYAELVSRLPLPDDPGASYHSMPELHTEADYATYINTRLAAWKASRQAAAAG